eukprot:gnl/Spiro4/17952_TR9572_c0_g1_i1.p1 gnl/Spiro4/17952_TR9572_c0_g1~~gnl/Spiro4/17952_TR9572_c0_g1_i1.p1  ORF type:complete len:327 (-),score=99.41 gnl/Spiro4/17952_TR9572_c0_g1_i1:55-1035(-)
MLQAGRVIANALFAKARSFHFSVARRSTPNEAGPRISLRKPVQMPTAGPGTRIVMKETNATTHGQPPVRVSPNVRLSSELLDPAAHPTKWVTDDGYDEDGLTNDPDVIAAFFPHMAPLPEDPPLEYNSEEDRARIADMELSAAESEDEADPDGLLSDSDIEVQYPDFPNPKIGPQHQQAAFKAFAAADSPDPDDMAEEDGYEYEPPRPPERYDISFSLGDKTDDEASASDSESESDFVMGDNGERMVMHNESVGFRAWRRLPRLAGQGATVVERLQPDAPPPPQPAKLPEEEVYADLYSFAPKELYENIGQTKFDPRKKLWKRKDS